MFKKNKIIILSITILLARVMCTNCEFLTKYPCMNTQDCKWATFVDEQDCSALSINDCSFNIDCYWDYTENICAGGLYEIDKSSCVDNTSVIDNMIENAYDYVQAKADQVFVDFLLSNGFKQLEINNEVIFKNENTTISYDELILGAIGVEFIDLKIENQGRGDDFFILKFDSISLNMTISQVVYIIKDIVDGNFDTINSFDFKVKGGYLYVSEDDIDVFEVSIDSFNIFFNGYINDDILSKIERYGIFPINDQIVKADLSGLKLHRIIAKDGTDLLVEPINIFGLVDFTKLYEITTLDLNIEYQPSINSFRMEYNLIHPYINSFIKTTSTMKFSHDFKLINSSWTNNHIIAAMNFTSPTNKYLNTDNIKGKRDVGEFILTKVPPKITFNTSLKDDSDIVAFIKSMSFLKKESLPYNEGYLNSNASFDMSADARSFAIDVADVKENYGPDLSSYESIKFNNFTTNMKVQNNIFNLNSNANTDLFNIYFNVMIDLLSGEINRFDIDMTNINSKINKYIDVIEHNAEIGFERQNNNIYVNITGSLNDHTVNGINFNKRYAKECKYYIKDLYNMAKVYKEKIGSFPTDGLKMNNDFRGYLPEEIFEKWKFVIDLTENNYSTIGTITAISLEQMEGGSGNILIFNVESGTYSGYGQ